MELARSRAARTWLNWKDDGFSRTSRWLLHPFPDARTSVQFVGRASRKVTEGFLYATRPAHHDIPRLRRAAKTKVDSGIARSEVASRRLHVPAQSPRADGRGNRSAVGVATDGRKYSETRPIAAFRPIHQDVDRSISVRDH